MSMLTPASLVADALAVWFGVEFVRVLPGVRGLLMRGVRPFACDVCMCAWLALSWCGAAALRIGDHSALWAVPGAAGGGLVLLRLAAWMVRPRGAEWPVPQGSGAVDASGEPEDRSRR